MFLLKMFLLKMFRKPHSIPPNSITPTATKRRNYVLAQLLQIGNVLLFALNAFVQRLQVLLFGGEDGDALLLDGWGGQGDFEGCQIVYVQMWLTSAWGTYIINALLVLVKDTEHVFVCYT